MNFNKVMLVIVLGVVSSIFSGFVLTKLWSWFVVPTFDLPQLTVPIAIGIYLTVSFMTKNNTSTLEDQDFPDIKEIFNLFSRGLGRPTAALLLGYVIVQFI